MPTDADATLTLCCLLWAVPGEEAGLGAYEDAVLALVAEHGGEVLSRARGDGASGHPHEVQLFRFAAQAGLDGYLADPRRLALAGERDRVVARTELFPVAL
ncbi:hypothetical protein [Agromyces soli]|uniref:DUF1330 domain-containing protein n=1 Tax=Agromyces soli TaxID=659012 RepID=A0ABY4AWV3_9MICO|nr:hypothetical protein [Agromyces soli]UOE26271.1 hypothetical protein MTP13_00395 [Agromyces soli]